MRIALITVLTLNWVLAPFSVAWAGSIDIDLGGTPVSINTTKYESSIQRLTDEFNTRQPDLRDGTRPPDLTREQYTKRVFVSAFKSYVRQVRKRDAAQACATYADFDAIEKAEVDDLLGGKSPCL